MRSNYLVAIQESVEELRAHEQRLRGQKAAQRRRLLVLLKSGQAKTLVQAAPLVGYRISQVVRCWERYRAGGLEVLEQAAHYPGQTPRLTAEARADLHAAMRRGEIATLEQARSMCRSTGAATTKVSTAFGGSFATSARAKRPGDAAMCAPLLNSKTP